MKKDSIPYVVLFTFVTCVVFVLPLAFADGFTKARVAENRLYAAHVAVLKAFGLADAATPKDEVEGIYAAGVVELPGDAPAWRAEIEGQAYLAVRATGSGLWGSITAIVAADAAGTRLRGLEILDQVETPGLGGRIDEAWFKEQFRGERIVDGSVSVDQAGTGKGDPDRENGRVDAVTGASRTSDFIEAIVNGAIADIRARGGAK